MGAENGQNNAAFVESPNSYPPRLRLDYVWRRDPKTSKLRRHGLLEQAEKAKP